MVEVKDVEIPHDMQRAMARQAEAERERRAKVIAAEGEYQASERLKDAAMVIEPHPIALQLRYLQTLIEISSSSDSTTIVFPAPVDILARLLPGAIGAAPAFPKPARAHPQNPPERAVRERARETASRAACCSRKRRAASIAAPRFSPLSLPCLISITVSTASMS